LPDSPLLLLPCASPCPAAPSGQNRLLALNYIYPGEDPAVCAAHAEWGTRFAAQFTPLPPLTPADWDTTPGRPLRVSEGHRGSSTQGLTTYPPAG
jgi:hypothetical protein